MILTLILTQVSKVNACDGISEPAIQKVIAAAKSIEDFYVEDSEYRSNTSEISIDTQKKMSAASMVPINFSEQKHKLDYYSLGNITYKTKMNGQDYNISGSAVKIGKRCVLTSAHTLYGNLSQSISPNNNGQFDKQITFTRGNNDASNTFNASVFFQMTTSSDYKIENNKRVFKGHNDLVILKLDRGDDYYKKVKVVSPEEIQNGMDIEVGKKISCHGSPSYQVNKKYGSCKGSDFRWKQENARIFEDDVYESGLITNLASTPGMSGGPCYMNESPDNVFAVVSNGFHGSDLAHPIMPNVKFEGQNYATGDARYLSLLHVLDKRMKSELGYGLDQITDKCN